VQRVMHARSLGRARHEFRFGGRELAILGAVFCLIATIVFAAGVMVGREMARAKGGGRAEIGREHHSPEPDGLRGPETPVKTAAAKAEEKVTFYRTLTAPTQDLPQVGKPTIEERLIPKEDGAPATAVDAAPATSRPEADPSTAAVKPSKPAEAAPAPRPARPAKAPPASPARPPQQVASAASTSDPDAAWTVQVSAFRSRSLAEELRSRLAARGYEAYVSPAMSEDGRPRYRVRVGAYAARGDAERVAADLRGERGLSPVVTQRTR
jgi:cell division septation protein DedD